MTKNTMTMKKIIDELIKCSIENADVYRWKDSTWLIFSKETRWVVELTDEGTLWYNYKFFKDVFKYVSMNLGQEMDGYIIQWANDFFYKDCAYRAAPYPRDKDRTKTPNVVENGIKEAQGRGKNHGDEFEWHTRAVVDNGIKEVNQSDSIHRQRRAENEMSRMIKEVKPNRVTVHGEKMDRFYYDPECNGNKTFMDEIIKGGVKKVQRTLMYSNSDVELIVKKVKPNIEYSEQTGVYDPDCNGNKTEIWRIVDECIKNIYPDHNSGEYDWSGEFETGKIIEGGVKL